MAIGAIKEKEPVTLLDPDEIADDAFVGDPDKTAHIGQDLAEKALARIVEMAEDHLDSVKTSWVIPAGSR
jgi:hypothetical protein